MTKPHPRKAARDRRCPNVVVLAAKTVLPFPLNSANFPTPRSR